MRLYVFVMMFIVAATPAAAAQSNADAAAAEKLFRDAQDLLKAGKVAAACDAFAGSQRLEPRAATLLNLAHCRELNGELATAWGLYLQVVSALRSDPTMAATARSAQEKASAVEPRLSHLIINVPDESRVEGLTILRNGEPIDPAMWNRAIPVDGGTYEIAARAADHEPWATRVTVGRELDKQSVDVPRFKSVGGGAAVPAGAAADLPVDRSRDGRDVGGAEGMTGRRKLALGLGAGAVALAAGGVMMELSGRSTYDAYEASSDVAERESLYEDANGKHRLAQGLGLAAVVTGGAAAFLWLTGGREAGAARTAVVPALSGDGAGLTVHGRF